MRYTILRILSCAEHPTELSWIVAKEQIKKLKTMAYSQHAWTNTEWMQMERKIKKAFSVNIQWMHYGCSAVQGTHHERFAHFQWVELQSTRRCSAFSWPILRLCLIHIFSCTFARHVHSLDSHFFLFGFLLKNKWMEKLQFSFRTFASRSNDFMRIETLKRLNPHDNYVCCYSIHNWTEQANQHHRPSSHAFYIVFFSKRMHFLNEFVCTLKVDPDRANARESQRNCHTSAPIPRYCRLESARLSSSQLKIY